MPPAILCRQCDEACGHRPRPIGTGVRRIKLLRLIINNANEIAMRKGIVRFGYRPARSRAAAAQLATTKPTGRGVVASRLLAAIPANYVVTSSITACLARTLPGDRADAAVTATLASFAIFAGLVVLCFSLRSVLRLWLVLIVLAAVTGLATWASIATGGRL